MRKLLFITTLLASFAASPVLAQEAQVEKPRAIAPAPPAIDAQDAKAESERRRRELERTSFVEVKNYEALTPKQSDYPPEAWVAGQEGTVGYLLYVGPDGKPQACEVIETSGFELLDGATCMLLMERGEFHPAINGLGEPVIAEFPGQYRWERKEPQYAGSMTVHVAFTIDEKGQTIDCETVEIGGMISERMRRRIEREPCPGMNRTDVAPYRDDDGVPVAKRVNLLLQVQVEDTDN